ncbi:MAG: GTPase ObgE [Candidatus Krumholzibacteriia bacterium]
MFIDVAIIHVAGGRGGDGCISVRREKFVPRGGPDGGDGGRGGSVVFAATSDSTTLMDFRYRRRYQAKDGSPGGGQRRTGAAGEDVVIPVPCGTSVFRVETGELLGDLIAPEDRLLVASGGRGGKGNWQFRSSRNQTPRKATSGQPGESLEVRLELRLIADVGLVGAPNAGKSTLLSVLTAAQPKVADYPFTTLVPNLGIADLGDYASCTLADIPGLIEGAAAGKGLGHEFLRHIERTRALLLLVDAADGEPWESARMLREELGAYGHGLERLPFTVVLTKSDLLDESAAAAVQAKVENWARTRGAETTLMISSATGSGLGGLRRLLRRWPAPQAPDEPGGPDAPPPGAPRP